MKLGKLQEVDIRKVWPHEQYDFSKWLAEEENIKELGGTRFVKDSFQKLYKMRPQKILCNRQSMTV